MIYFDDIAVWTKTQKGSIVRGVLCGICVLALGFIIWRTCSDIDKLEATISANEVTLAEKQYQLSAIEKKIADYDVQSITTTYMASDCGDLVSEKQVNYFSILRGTDIDLMNEALIANESELNSYISGRNSNNGPWYSMNTQNVKRTFNWSFLTRQASVVEDVPSIWVLISSEDSDLADTPNVENILSVAVANYDASSQTFSGLEIYNTYAGNVFKETYSIPHVGNIVSENCLVNSANSDEYYAAWRSLLDGVEYVPSDDAETVSENTVEDSTEVTTEESDDSDDNSSDDDSDESNTTSNLDALNSALSGGDN